MREVQGVLDLLDRADVNKEKVAKKVKETPKVVKKPQKKKTIKLPTVTPDMIPENYILVDNIDVFNNMLKCLYEDYKNDLPIAFDSETHTYFDNPLPQKDIVVGLSFYTTSEENTAWYVPVGHKEGTQLSKDQVMAKLKPFLESGAKIVGHNLKYDYEVMKSDCGIEIKNLYYDTMLAAIVMNENEQSFALKELAKRYLKRDDAFTYKELFGKTKFDEVPLYIANWYASKDAELTFDLYIFQIEYLNTDKLKNLKNILFNIEMPLLKVVAEMELGGIYIDVPYLRDEVGIKLEQEIQDLDKRMRKAFGVDGTFNFNSPKQLGELLYTELKLPIYSRTSTGNPSTDAKTLSRLADKHEGVKLLLEFRERSKLKSTYVDGIVNKVVDGKVYPSFDQLGTATGRFSSRNPNFQNLPSGNTMIRRAIIPPEGYKILNIDYSQIELRILASLSRDPNMVDAYNHGKDIHSQTASLVFDIPYEKFREAEDADTITDEYRELQNMRKKSKTVNFGIIYGQTAYGLATGLEISEEEAQYMIDGWFRAYPQAKKWLDATVNNAYSKGYTETMAGRKRRLQRYLYSEEAGRRRFGERQAMNSPIQGSASDLLKIAMVKVYPYLVANDCKLIATIHDEIMVYVPEDLPDASIMEIKDIMTTALDIGVPLKCDAEIQTRWSERERSL